MRIVVLSDNNTLIGTGLKGEPGACYYIEDGDFKMLLDVGYLGVFLENADIMGIDLGEIKTIAISHGHDDHVGGFRFMKERFDLSDVEIIAHPLTFRRRPLERNHPDSIMSAESMEKLAKIRYTREPLKLSEHIWYLGEIERKFDFEKYIPEYNWAPDGEEIPDTIPDDTALAYETDEGVYVITGCSHSGICNIIEQAKRVTGKDRLLGVIGGFHILEKGEKLDRTVEYLAGHKDAELMPCHCVCFAARAAINEAREIREIGVGSEIIWK